MRQNSCGLSLVEVIAVVVIIVVLVAMLFPCTGSIGGHSRSIHCANNLSQLWKMENIYMAQFGGRERAMPAEGGSAFWLKLKDTKPPLIEETEADIYVCPVSAHPATPPKETDYWGPVPNIASLGDGDIVGCDDEPHPDSETRNVLRKSGDVIEAGADNPVFVGSRRTVGP